MTEIRLSCDCVICVAVQCGMPAAYTISIMSSGKGKWRKDEEKKDDDDYADDTDKQEEKGGEVRMIRPSFRMLHRMCRLAGFESPRGERNLMKS